MELIIELKELVNINNITLTTTQFDNLVQCIHNNKNPESNDNEILYVKYLLAHNEVRKCYNFINDLIRFGRLFAYKLMTELIEKMQNYISNIKLPQIIYDCDLQELTCKITNIEDLIDIFMLYTKNIARPNISYIHQTYIGYNICYMLEHKKYDGIDNLLNMYLSNNKHKHLLLMTIYQTFDIEKAIEQQKILLEEYNTNVVGGLLENYKKINKIHEFYAYVLYLASKQKDDE